MLHFTPQEPLAPGWYRVRVRIAVGERHAVRKQGELLAEFDQGPPQPLAAFAWNESLSEDVFAHLPRPARRLTLTLRHAGGAFRVERFDAVRVGPVAATLRAVRAKLKLLAAYGNLRPVAAKGVRLLLSGRVGEFRRKLLKGLTDARALHYESAQGREADAAPWRRPGIPPEEAAELRAAVADLADPRAVGVVLRVGPGDGEAAPLAVASVLRQVYLHWRLVIDCAKPSAALREAARGDTRVVFGPAETVHGLGCDTVFDLPPGAELREDAVYGMATAPAARDSHPGLTPATPPRLSPGGTGVLARGVNPGPVAAPGSGALVLAGDIIRISGYDHFVFAFLRELRRHGVHVQRHPVARMRDDLVPPELRPPVARRPRGLPTLVATVPFLLHRYRPGPASAVYTMWETERLDPAWVKVMNRAAVVIVPSEWGRDCFRANGVRVPVEVVPLGYDPDTFAPGGNFPPECVFGTAGALDLGGVRKDAQRVIDLFRQALPTEPDVRLRVKVTPNSPPLDTAGDPRIEVVAAFLPHAELAAWYRSLTAFVSASHAEGFGLHLLEAMACGRPLISPAYSGEREFFDESAGYVVPHTVVDVRNEVYDGRWADPDGPSLVAAMRKVYADRAEAERLGAAAAERARGFTWEESGRELVAALARHGLLGKTPGRIPASAAA